LKTIKTLFRQCYQQFDLGLLVLTVTVNKILSRVLVLMAS